MAASHLAIWRFLPAWINLILYPWIRRSTFRLICIAARIIYIYLVRNNGWFWQFTRSEKLGNSAGGSFRSTVVEFWTAGQHDRSTYWPAVQRATTVPLMPPQLVNKSLLFIYKCVLLFTSYMHVYHSFHYICICSTLFIIWEFPTSRVAHCGQQRYITVAGKLATVYAGRKHCTERTSIYKYTYNDEQHWWKILPWQVHFLSSHHPSTYAPCTLRYGVTTFWWNNFVHIFNETLSENIGNFNHLIISIQMCELFLNSIYS